MKHANTTNKLTLKVRSIRQMTPHHLKLAETLGLEPTVAVPRADGSVVQLARKPIRLSRTPVTY
jgi:hypothetical protein